MNLFAYEKLPLLGSLNGWVDWGHPVGGFLSAVLENDLKRAVMAADDVNVGLIPIYVSWLYNKAPSACWGSPGAYEKWMKLGGKNGLGALVYESEEA